MQKSKQKPYALMAGVCYGICGLYSIITRTAYGRGYFILSTNALNIVFYIATIGMAVALFLKNEKAVIAAAGVHTIYALYYCLQSLFVRRSWWGTFLQCFFVTAAYASVVALLLLTLKKNAVVQKIWFVAGAAPLLGNLIYWIEGGYFSWISERWIWKSMLFSLIEIAGLILLGLWIKEHDFTPSEVEPVNEYSTFDPQVVYSSPLSDSAIGGAEKLKMYKELLDAGVLTQEEFDAKKKQILGL